MKNKRIVAMFVASAVALVASVVVTLGIALTLADPVPVSFVTSCKFEIGTVNAGDKIVQNGNVLTYVDAFSYQPVGSMVVNNWDVNADDCDAPVYPRKNQEFGVELQVEESDVNKIKIAYVEVKNTTGEAVNVKVGASFNKASELGKYTKVVVYDYATGLFSTVSTDTFAVPANATAEFAVIVYTDISDKHDANELVFGQVKENISIVVEKV